MNQKISLKRVLFSFLIGLGAGLSVFLPILILLVPAFLGFVGAAWGTACFATAVLGAAATLFFLVSDAAVALYLLAAFLPASVILAYVLIRKRPYRYAVILLSAVFALFGYAVFCLPSVLAGGGPFDAVSAEISAVMDQIRPLLPQFLGSQEQVELMEAYLSAISDRVPEMVVLLILGLSELFAFLNTVLARTLLVRAKAEHRPMAPLIMWQLPKDFVWGALILSAGAAACTFFGFKNASAIVAAAECIVVLPFALMGLAFFEFSMLVSPRRGNGWRVITYVALVLLFPTSLIILAGFGVIDRVMRVRSRIVRRK